MRASGLSGPGSAAALPAGRGDLAPSPRVATDDRGVFLQWVPLQLWDTRELGDRRTGEGGGYYGARKSPGRHDISLPSGDPSG